MTSQKDSSFLARVESLIVQIPRCRVMTYGQIAALCGSPRAARVVGGIAHYGDPQLPWHRVVNKGGGLARGYPGGKRAHAKHLQAEGILVEGDYSIDINKYLYRP